MSEDWSGSTQRLINATQRLAALLRQADDGSRRVVGSDWTIHEVATHLASLSDAYVAISSGEPSPYPDMTTRAEVNHARLVVEPEQDLGSLADRCVAGIGQTADNLSEAGPDRTYTHVGVVFPARAFRGLVLLEFLVHGFDIARTLRVAWPIAHADALMVVDLMNATAPALVSHDRARHVNATLDVRIRGGPRSTYSFRNGGLTVSAEAHGRADVHMSVDPVSWVLLAYRRRRLSHELLRGRAIGWGKKPWLAFRFLSFFETP